MFQHSPPLVQPLVMMTFVLQDGSSPLYIAGFKGHVGRHIFSVIVHVHVHAMHHTSIAHAVSMNDIIAFIKLQVQVHLYAYVQ